MDSKYNGRKIMETFLKIQNRRINILYIVHYEVKEDKENGDYDIIIYVRDAGYKDEIHLNYTGETARKRFATDLKKIDGLLRIDND